MHEDQSEKQHWARQAWDAAQESPIIEDELKPRKFLSFIQIIICTLVGILVFGLAFFSKASLLLLINLCMEKSTTIETKAYASLFIGCLLIAPSVLLLIKSIWKITFKDSKTPSMQTLLWILFVETLVAAGSSILTLITMPQFDILTNVMLLNGIATLSALLQVNVTFADYCSNFTIVEGPALGIMRLLLNDLTRNLCHHMGDNKSSMDFGLLGSSLVSWWLGLVLCTLYIWFLNTERIARTKDLFVRNLYEAAFIDPSMLLNSKFEIQPISNSNREKEKVTIYLCATMWHETADEMMKMIISMFRLDKFRPKKNQFNDVVFESHIYFDDAFLTKDNKRCVNEYAETLAEVIREVYVIFSEDSKSEFRDRKPLPNQKIFQTPYGCRLQYTLPYGNILFVHFTGTNHQIRHKKEMFFSQNYYYKECW
ncbi:hypothetical protein AMELA_G00274110 [Ameiurus melas]|uniref:Uncharacterized protein n=1 Tax=Ameiurus melas TaxID=219545 RepID=A0A7J5ZM28_AMEME|nr:hypothetical protein AMELA_G00274110 [Ameiurus melas]